MNDVNDDDNHEQALRQELHRVSARYRQLLLRVGLAGCWLALASAGLAALAWSRGAGHAVPGIVLILLIALPVVLVPVLLRALRAVRDPLWVARRLEQRFPDLDARLLAALDQRADGNGDSGGGGSARRLGYLQHTVIGEAVAHSEGRRWDQLVPAGRLRVAQVAQWAMLVAFAAALVTVLADMWRRPGSGGWLAGGPAAATGAAFEIKVEPGDTEVERGTGLLVLARFGSGADRLPGDVALLYRTADGEVRQAPMSKSLDDPVFAGRVASVDRDLTYAVRYGDAQTRWYKAAVFDYPDLKQADARLTFPEYTGLEEKLVEDTRSVTAVEGTRARFTFRLNKPVAEARLLPGRAPTATDARPATGPSSITLTPDPADPNVYSLAIDLQQSQNFRLQLVDADGRRNKRPPELVVNVTQNRPPELKLQWPGRDVDVSPLEELSIRAQAWDDFGLRRVGVSYGLAGREAQEVVLGERAAAKETRDVAQLVSLEKLAAKPDELLSYHVWAEDVGPDGRVRRTEGDMFFAEVRDFEQIFRQGQQPAGGEQQQQQQQGGQNGQEAEQLAELQKQIIAATWKLVRRETGAAPTAEFAADATLVGESQTAAHGQASALGERLGDERSRAHLKNVLRHMDDAAAQLASAAAGPSPDRLRPALAAEQAAYQELLKLRAREIEVVRGQRQQQQQGGESGAAQRRQQQLNELELDREENRYETQRQAAPQQQESAEQRETRQVLDRLRELAQRQEDLNRQMRELQSALEKAQDEARREEIRRQLARLRDQQQQQLRDTDELRDRMEQPENQQRMAESREQLEQTRENVRRASEALEQGRVPEAAAEGARAGEQLDKLRDQFRQAAAGQFNEAMDRMRQDARELDRKQQELSDQLTELDEGQQQQQWGLRDSGERQQVAKGLGEQKQELDRLLEDMRRTTEEAEVAEPLLSKKLYDAVREAHQEKTDQALDASGQLLDQGFVNEAREAEGEAAKGITRLREGVEQAAESVLGDEAEALRRARDELDALAQELEREIGRRAGGPTTQPGQAGDGERGRAGEVRTAQGEPTTRENVAMSDGERDGGQPGSRGEARQARAGNEPGSREGRGPEGDPQDGRRGAGRQSREGEPREGGEPQQEGGAPRGGAGRQQASAQPGRQGEGESPEGDQPGRGGEGQEPQGNQPGRRGNQPGRGGSGQQQGESEVADAQEGEGEQPGDQPGQSGAQGRGGQAGQQPRRGGESGQQGESGGATARAGGLRRGGSDNGGTGSGPAEAEAGGDLRRFVQEGTGPAAGEEGRAAAGGPITGENFREWSDRLRDVEDSVGDPRLRAEAARIRDRAREVRAEFNRHSEEPNWDLVREFVSRPLVELREQVAQELARRESPESLVPIDREPVPPEYADQVRRYYERLGGGR